jgi:uncharacterized protein
MLEFDSVRMEFPSDTNIMIGQTHFIKTAEDIYEAVVNTVPGAQFGVAFNEASGPCLIRVEGNNDELCEVAACNAQAIGAGHVFVLVVRNAYPIISPTSSRLCRKSAPSSVRQPIPSKL